MHNESDCRTQGQLLTIELQNWTDSPCVVSLCSLVGGPMAYRGENIHGENVSSSGV